MSETPQEQEEKLNAAEARLVELTEKQWPGIEATIKEFTEKLNERQEALNQVKTEVDEHRTLIANLKNIIGHRKINEETAKEHLGLPEWQKKTVDLMQEGAGTPYHYLALLRHLKVLNVSIFDKKGVAVEGDKACAAMLSFMKTLIVNSKVQRTKGSGNYTWSAVPWKAQAPVIPINKASFSAADTVRKEISDKLISDIASGREWKSQDLEKHFHQVCLERGVSKAGDWQSDYHFVEYEVVAQSQQDRPGLLSMYEKDPVNRVGDAFSTCLVISRSRQSPTLSDGVWKLMRKPAAPQRPLAIKRPSAKT